LGEAWAIGRTALYVRGLGLNVLADLAIKSKSCVGDLIGVGLTAAQSPRRCFFV
jgi:hypothetical protein